MGGERIPGRGEFPAGSTVASYQIEALIGRGGMAKVYRATDIRLGRPVALKILADELASDEGFRQRFVRESRAGAAVDHPNVIPVFEAGDAAGVLYIAMRYVPGLDLRALIAQDGPLPTRRAVSIVTQIASALDAAHAHGLVHRDVKPANILLGRVGDGDTLDHVYLSDFGLSKLPMGANAHLTGTGQFLGTIDYMAPEQVSGREVDGRTDQYALACATFEMLAGTPPFQRTENLAAIWAQVSASPPSVRARRPELPPAVDDVLNKALAKSPADRYPTCVDFAAALRAACTRPPVQADPPPGLTPADLAMLTAPTAENPVVPGHTATELAEGGLGAIGLAPRFGAGPVRPVQGGQSPGGLSPGGLSPGGQSPGGQSPGGVETVGYNGPPPVPQATPGGYPGGGYPGGGYPGGGYSAPPGYPPPRKKGKGPLILLGVVLVAAIAAGAVYLLHPGGLFKPISAASPTPTVTVTPSRSTAPSASPTTPTSASASATTTIIATNPADTVTAYYNAINNKDYTAAWNINVQVHQSETYSQFVAGYSGTKYDSVTIAGVSGNVVSIQLNALQTDGTTKNYQGTYTIVNSQIVGSNIQQG